MSDFWGIVGSAATAIGSLFSGVGLFVVGLQLVEMKRTRKLQAYFPLLDYLHQSDEARGLVLRAKSRGTPFPDHLATSEVDAAKTVCRTYDTLGILVGRKLLPEDLILYHWHNPIAETWSILKDWVYAERKRLGYDYSENFRKLAEKAAGAAKNRGET